jgi:hypothetical protein
MGRFETKWLCRPENLAALADLPGRWIDKVHQRRPPKMIVLDMDSSESPTYDDQKAAPTTGISPAPAITRCSSSTNSAMSSVARCDPATCTAPMVGTRFERLLASCEELGTRPERGQYRYPTDNRR